MKNGKSRYDGAYARMEEKPDVKRAIQIFNAMTVYMDFYERWIRTCSALNRKQSNPNRRLMARWIE